LKLIVLAVPALECHTGKIPKSSERLDLV